MTARSILAAVLCAVVAGQVAAQAAFPARAVRIIVPFAPGGSADTMARLIGNELTRSLGQPVVVENRPGGASMIGVDAVAKSVADGHTIGLVATGAIAINPALFAKMPFDPVKDLTPIALIATIPMVLVAGSGSGIGSLGELVTRARTKPGSLAFGTTGNGSAMHLSGTLLQQQLGFEMTHIPYKGSAPAVADAMAGQVPLAFVDLTSALPHIRSGKVIALGTAGIKRTATAPELPTLAERGAAGFDATGWLAIIGPAALSAPVVERLNSEINRVMAMAEIREKSLAVGAEPMVDTPAGFAAFARSETEKWARAVKAANLRIE